MNCVDKVIKDSILTAKLYDLSDLPYSSVRRKAELKRRKDVFRKLLLRKKQSDRIKRKYRTREEVRLRTAEWRARGASFREKIEYYDSLEKSYWYYLKKKYGISKILSLEEFEEHIAPRYKPGFNVLARRDKSRKDWFLDNIKVLSK